MNKYKYYLKDYYEHSLYLEHSSYIVSTIDIRIGDKVEFNNIIYTVIDRVVNLRTDVIELTIKK